MLRAADGDEHAFEVLLERHQAGVIRFLAQGGAAHDATDLAQETFVRVYRHRHLYRPRAKFTTYLYTIARHVLVDYLRKRNRRPEVAHDDVSVSMLLVEHQPEGLVMDVEQALAGLSERLRLVIVLRIIEGFTAEETAEILELPVGTVKSRLHLGIRALRKPLEVYEHELR
jgi:RNA polymerase sigma-70 factor (ECF subfamily)